MTLTYQLVKSSGHLGIKCLLCGRVSYNVHDIRQRYCGHCHRFHDDQPESAPAVREAMAAPIVTTREKTSSSE